MRRLAAAAVRYLKSRSVKNIAFLAREARSGATAAQAVTEGLLLGNFDGDKYRTDKKSPPAAPPSNPPCSSASNREPQAAVDRGRIIAESQNFARELGNEPSNLLTPAHARRSRRSHGPRSGLAVDILDEKRIAELKMGALLSVARAASSRLA